MHILILDLVSHLRTLLNSKGVADSQNIAEACAFLEATGYPGLATLKEALSDEVRSLSLVKDVLGLDLKNVSCVFLASALGDYVSKGGRVFLRNVRHGLYLLPDSVASNYGIGCPVDPSFSIGGERTKNPYVEKWDAAMAEGIEVDEAVWEGLVS
jgi:hypothetical protein